jgi:hypothetical protein
MKEYFNSKLATFCLHWTISWFFSFCGLVIFKIRIVGKSPNHILWDACLVGMAIYLFVKHMDRAIEAFVEYMKGNRR